MRFLLDTNICVYALNGNEIVLREIVSHRRPDLAVSSVSAAELHFGVENGRLAERHRLKLRKFLDAIDILEFTSIEAEVYGRLRASLTRAGTPIGELDTLIAAHAKALDLVLVTNNEREFRRVPGLRIENWAA